MSIERMHSGPRMSQIVVHGGVVHLAGQVAQRAPGASVGEQTTDILARIGRAARRGRDRQVEAALGDHLAHRHGRVRGDERGMGCVDRSGEPARPRLRPVPGAGRTRVQRRDHGERRGVTRAHRASSWERRRPITGSAATPRGPAAWSVVRAPVPGDRDPRELRRAPRRRTTMKVLAPGGGVIGVTTASRRWRLLESRVLGGPAADDPDHGADLRRRPLPQPDAQRRPRPHRLDDGVRVGEGRRRSACRA